MTVHVVGNLCVDRTFRLARLPRAGETVNASASLEGVGGKGANQAVAAARAGADVRLYAAVGADVAGERLAVAMRGEGIDLALARVALPTDMSVILVDPAGENVIVTAAACAEAFDPLAETDLAARLAPGDILLMQGNLGPAATAACLAAARGAGVRAVLNPSPLGPAIPDLDGLALVIANASEARALTGRADPFASAEALRRAGAAVAVVTLGPDGAVVADDEDIVRRPAPAVTAVDTSGAGDCFAGTLTALIAEGWPLGDVVAIAQRAAAIAVTRPGTLAAFPSRAELAALRAGTSTRRAIEP